MKLFRNTKDGKLYTIEQTSDSSGMPIFEAFEYFTGVVRKVSPYVSKDGTITSFKNFKEVYNG